MVDEPSFYDLEAGRYDATRGGHQRADAAADAVVELVAPPGTLVDVAGGTGTVTRALQDRGFTTYALDLSPGMLRLAAQRVPGRVAVASADRLPLRDGSVDVVTAVWLLHLLPVPTADAVLAEAARVLRPGGTLVATVDKSQAHGGPGSEADRRVRVEAVAARLGLARVAATSFTGPSVWGSAGPGDPVFPLLGLRRA